MTSLIIAALLAASGPARAAARLHPAPAPAQTAPAVQLSDEEVREQVRAFLGTIDTPIGAEQWRALGTRAEPALREVIAEKEGFPSRRAKAVDGIAALGGSKAPQLLRDLAQGEAEPLVVRLSALRGLGRLLPEKKLVSSLRPILEKAEDSRVRAAAGEVLAHHARSSCGLVKEQIARESEEKRGQFERAFALCDTAAKPAQ